MEKETGTLIRDIEQTFDSLLYEIHPCNRRFHTFFSRNNPLALIQ
jgi:hypothetical protein